MNFDIGVFYSLPSFEFWLNSDIRADGYFTRRLLVVSPNILSGKVRSVLFLPIDKVNANK
jgi:hypothetical protein